jgi:caspase domain-containing protein
MKKNAILVGLGDFYGNNNPYVQLKFVYQNIKDLSGKLQAFNWVKAPTPLLDETAYRQNIIDTLTKTISGLNDDDWLLFYYTGHGDVNNDITYCVTFTTEFTNNNSPSIDQFFSQKDYDSIISQFNKQCPKGHLITILDCCDALGMVQNFTQQKDFHTIFAASSANSNANYRTNSFFFDALSMSWDEDTFQKISDDLKTYIDIGDSSNTCQILIAKNFINNSFNS